MYFFEDVIEKDNFIFVNRMIQEFGGWLVLRLDWKEDIFNLIDFLSKINLYINNLFLIYMYVYDDLMNFMRNILYVRLFFFIFMLVL